MAQAITRLFDSHTEAMAAVEELERAGIPESRISLVASNADKWHGGEGRRGAADHDDKAEGASKGAGAGGLIGGGAGLLAGLGMLAIPGLGPVVAAGWLASTAVGAVAGAIAGGAAGGLLGALKDAGHSEEEANVYAEGVRRGGSLVSVKAESDEAATAERILGAHGGVDAGRRGQSYRESGWQRFDETAAPYGADQMAAERDRYREERSFTAGGERDSATEAREREGGTTGRPIDPATRNF